LDGWLGELGRKNLLLLAASLGEFGEFGDFGDFGDWKLKTENWKLKKNSLSKPATTTKKNYYYFFIFFIFYFLFFSRLRGRGFYRVGGR
jgi:hypothetical protein